MSEQLRKVEVLTHQQGSTPVPAAVPIEGVDHFAVTMTQFGLFEVTHIQSGKRIIGSFERSVNAHIAMLQLQLALNELGVDSSLDTETFVAEVAAKDSVCESLGMSLFDWIRLHKMTQSLSGEFPWEGGDEGPHAELDALFKKLNENAADVSATE